MEKASCDGPAAPDRQLVIKLVGGAVDMAQKTGWDHVDISYAEAYDILLLLNESEPRLLTPEDFDNNPMADENGFLPAWVEYRKYNGIARPFDGWGTINKLWINGFNDRRFWTSKPTDQQRKETPWNEQ